MMATVKGIEEVGERKARRLVAFGDPDRGGGDRSYAAAEA
jgi:hypothetical protein